MSSTESGKTEWVEIIEPRSKEYMYANLITGSCVWDPPEGVFIKRADSSQWWELFDTKTDRFYYYNVASQKTVWHRPQNCDIIPLAKLQILKQSSEPEVQLREKESSSSSKGTISKQQNNSKDVGSLGSSSRSRDEFSKDSITRGPIASGKPKLGTSLDKRNSEKLASPTGRHSFQHCMPSADDQNKYYNPTGSLNIGQSSSSANRSSQKYMDSSKSSDSSLSSVHGHLRIQDGSGSLRVGNIHNKKYGSDNKMLQESSSSHNIPHVAVPSEKNHQYGTNSSDKASASTQSPSHTSGTPIMKKKLYFEAASRTKEKDRDRERDRYRERDRERDKSTKHQSFDYSENPPQSISLTRSGSFMSPVAVTGSLSRQVQPQRKCSFDGNGGSDDSMHEKYFKSVENTPVSRRRHTTSSKQGAQKHSSDSSPQSPISPQNQVKVSKQNRPSVLGLESSLTKKSSHKNDPDMINLDIAVKQDRYSDKMKLTDKGKTSPAVATSNLRQIQQINQLLKPSNIKSPSSQNQIEEDVAIGGARGGPTTNSLNKNSLRHQQQQQQQQQYPQQQQQKDQTLDRKLNSKNRKKNYGTINDSEMEYDNGNMSPLYSNWDQEMQEHLLPLQHYILEQAKLSGCYGSNDQYDSDSIHSDSHSEHSFSGHEPDNEDSDHSDGRGDYLTHYPYEEYGAHRGGPSYYNYMDFGRNDGKEDISEEVTAKLESMQDQIYSPVKHHPPPMLKYTPGFSGMPPPSMKPMGREPNLFHFPANQSSPFQPPPSVSRQATHIQNQAASSQFAQKGQTKTLLQRFQEQLSSNSNDKIAEMALIKECDIEKFAQDNLNLHSKGIFRKKSSVRDMLSWTGNAITRPMLSLARDKTGKKLAIEVFKLAQIYMGDRKARAGMTLNSVALDIISAAVANPSLRDELYVQLCRQTTENPKRESLIRGWELLTICLSFIPPSPTFQPALLGYMNRHRDPTFAKSFPEIGKWPIHVQISHYATIACRRLDRIGCSGKKQARKPNEEEINQARDQIFRDSMFGNTLQEVMDLQREIFPDRKIPWIQQTLSEQVLLMGGKQTEGIFRVSADVDEVNCLKAYVDKWEFPENKGSMDAHVPASLLKLWYRELYDPLFPDELYEECVATEDPKEAAAIIEKLPVINKLVLTYLVRFLQEFSHPDVVQNTKMDSSNLAMVFAPNCLKCTSQDPKVILENARKEMAFMRTLILNMDTSSVGYLI